MTDLEHLRSARTRLWHRVPLDGGAASWLERGERALEQAATGEVLGHGRGAARVVRLEEAGADGVWRTNRHGGSLGGLWGDRYLDTARLEQELTLSAELHAAGLPTPEVLCALAVRRGPFWRQHLVTRRIPGATTAFDARDSAAVHEAAHRLLSALFDFGLWATDLHPANLLWEEAARRIWVIDLAGASRRPRPLDAEARQARWDRYRRYFLKHAGEAPESVGPRWAEPH